MNVKLICKDEDNAIMTSILKKHHFSIRDDASILVVDRNLEYKEDYELVLSFRSDALDQLDRLLNTVRFGHITSNIIIGRMNESYIPINIEDIVYFNARGNYTYANTVSGQQLRIIEKLYQLELELLPSHFIRTNKSEIVNIYKIKRISPMLKGNVVIYLEGYKEPYDISRNYIKMFKERLGLR